jgi:hypothetical protein
MAAAQVPSTIELCAAVQTSPAFIHTSGVCPMPMTAGVPVIQ